MQKSRAIRPGNEPRAIGPGAQKIRAFRPGLVFLRVVSPGAHSTAKGSQPDPLLRVEELGGKRWRIHLGGDWTTGDPMPDLDSVLDRLRNRDSPEHLELVLDDPEMKDARLLPVLLEIVRTASEGETEVDTGTLPEGTRRLLQLALAVPPRSRKPKPSRNPITGIGRRAFAAICESRGFIEFIGELLVSYGRLLTGRARFRGRDFWSILQASGVDALPIVSLIAVMVGIILGFVGAVQLQKFGATIYMIDLVGLAMAREMGAIMTGVILSGRTGAAFAAQISTMNLNEEIDALETLGISKMEFLVLPRTLALILMMPMLTLYADFLGWLGAFAVAIPMNISPAEFWIQLAEAVSLKNIGLGLLKSFFFGIVVATSGCYYGLNSGRSSAAVGEAATRAVVAGITWIIIFDAVFAFTFEILGW
jgi:phospholipid/cholesterol/gamma-HCH transport system permease protein